MAAYRGHVLPPMGSSVNDGIEEALCSLTYVAIKDVVRGIIERGCGTQLAKVDIKSAYRNTIAGCRA